MPAVSKAQLRKAYADENKDWAREMIEATHTTKGLPEHVRDRRRGSHKRRHGRRKEDRD
jgi:hypothetical protein